MATDTSALPVNGNYAAPGYDLPDQNYDPPTTDRSASNTADYATQSVGASTGVTSAGGNSDIPKDEVAWFFVEKYYTTLSKNPEKLFLFYNKSSQFVSGTETEKAPVCVGQAAINERIKELDIQDCKVRVTNVDSQASRSNIVIQVIGEISNKSAPQQKFTQTFVLAEQANGYFVLNDIFRYLLDDEEDFGAGEDELPQTQVDAASGYQEPTAAVPDTVSQNLASSDTFQEQARDTALVDQGLEKAIVSDATVEPAVPTINGSGVASVAGEAQEEEPAAPEVTTADETPVPIIETTQPAETVDELQAETPKDPVPSPAALSAQPAAAQPTAPAAAPKPAAPKTWANLVAGNRANAAVTPIVPATQSTTSSSAAAKATPPIQTQVSTTPTVPASSTPPLQDSDQLDTPQSSGSEWQTAGQEHSRKQSRTQGAQTPAENSRAYIKNVNDNVDVAALQAALAKISDVAYVDINRQKNCAFVDFATPAGYRAALAANPHEVSGERLYVEERRVRPPGSYPGGFNGRGGGPVRGNPRPSSQGRGGFQKEGTRGGYTGRGRGNVGSRGRGGVSQPA